MFGSHKSSGGVLSDFCDGSLYQEHQILKDHPTALQIQLYYDEAEVANPLGSSSKIHKLGMGCVMWC